MVGDTTEPLSHSSGNEILGCEQKYVYRKVQKVQRDNDAPRDTLALDLGKALHACLEDCHHDLTGFPKSQLRTKMADEGVPESQFSLLWAMLGRYRDLHQESELDCVVVEAPIRSANFIGYIDAVMEKDNKWWIVDVKTASMLNKFLPQILPRDKQLNLYYGFFEPETYGLDWENFGGCRYRVVTKSKLKRKKDDNDTLYSERMYKNIQAVEYVIPKEAMRPDLAVEEFDKLRLRQKQLWELPQRAKKNYNNCVSYFRPCEYWSKCHGTEYSSEPKVEEILA
jgi:hypothetical protein